MATITFETYRTTPGWFSLSSNNLCFSGSATSITTPISVTAWQDGTHAGDGTPGTDQCVDGPYSGHYNNVKIGSTTGKMIANGAAEEDLNDTNLGETECTLRIHLNNATSVETQNSRFFHYDGTTDTSLAPGLETYAFERGVSATTWTVINDATTSGKLTVGDVGGDNAGEYLDLGEKTGGATDLYWYLAICSSGETAGGKTQNSFKIKTEIF